MNSPHSWTATVNGQTLWSVQKPESPYDLGAEWLPLIAGGGAMRIKVAIEGHQSYREHVGEVLHWGSTVESFNQGRDSMAVPCVVLKEDSGRIITLPLKTEGTWSKVREIKAEGAPEVKA